MVELDYRLDWEAEIFDGWGHRICYDEVVDFPRRFIIEIGKA